MEKEMTLIDALYDKINKEMIKPYELKHEQLVRKRMTLKTIFKMK